MSDQSTLLLEHHLKELKLPTFLREYGKLAAQCAAEGVSHPDYLLRLAEVELTDRHQRMVQRRIRAARFPATKGLDTFDFSAIPSVNQPLVTQLARCEYVEHHENVIAIGNSGTGKTHVALGLGLAACQRGLSVGFTTCPASTIFAGWRQSVLPVHLLGLDALLGSVGPVAGDVKLQDDGVVHDPVNRRGGGHGVGKDALPLGEDQV